MAELAKGFIAERLDSRESLALLFVCECRRKERLDSLNFGAGAKPAAWTTFLDQFAPRLMRLPEAERVYLIGSHLLSVGALDIYSNDEVGALLNAHRDLLATLVHDLEHDARFA